MPRDLPVHSASQDFGAQAHILVPLHYRSREFWYPDGNVVLSLRGMYYKLYRSRLERFCRYFRELFSTLPTQFYVNDPEHAMGDPGADNGTLPLYNVSLDITLSEFDTFLKYLECPM